MTLPSKSRPCPICGSDVCRDVGPIFHARPALVAGVEIDLGDADFHLLHCPTCDFRFKDPPIPAEKLMACYAAAAESNWGLNPDPWERYFDKMGHTLRRFSSGRRVLDIGCFNGGLLRYLGPQWQRFGVEPARNAADLARSRGVTILGQTLDDIPPDSGQFDAVLAIDVIEHVTEPVPFFRLIRDLLRPGGIFMAFTGDTDTWPWRWYKNRHWYCSLPEHVSFYSAVAMEYLARSVEMHTVSHTHLGHQRMLLKSRLRERAKNAFFMTGTTIGWCGVPSLRQKYGGGAGPILLNVSDHMLHLMRRR